MDALETKTIIEQALRDPRNFPFAVYGIIFVVAAVGAYFGAYLRRKGQNFADKEDIKKLTEIVENVRSQHAKDLENLAQENREVIELMSQKHQLRLAALDSRLKAHQEAFTLWQELDRNKNTDQIDSIVIKCQKWWDNNCLYLDDQPRKAFIEAIHAARNHDNLLKCVVRGTAKKEEVKQNGDIIRATGAAIVQGAALPAINSNEVGIA